MAITYNTGSITLPRVYRATGGGVTFSTNLTATAAFDYFTDTAVVNDAIYFGNTGTYPFFSDLILNVGTAMAGTGITLVWEYWGGVTAPSAWVPIEKLVDNTVGFTATGAKTVQFPIQLNWLTNTVNGVSALWVRCRISAKTTITEGGANQTTAVTASDGKINIDGYTNETPCTWTEVYNYMTANYPYVGVVNIGNYFDFRRVIPIINSRLLSKNETIEMGIDMRGVSTPRLGISLNYLTNGVASAYDAGRGYDGSTYIMNGIINNYPFEWGANHISYDTEWRNPTIYSGTAGYLGYPALRGTFCDCKFQLVPSVPIAATIIKNCRFQQRSGFIATTFDCPNFLNNTMVVIGSSGAVFNIYTTGFSIEKLGFAFSSTGSIYRFNSVPTDGQVWTLKNPLSRTPGNTIGSPQTITTSPGAIANFANVFFYDASADTYTNYTTAASSAGTADVPVNGDVDDCLYMNFGTASSGHCAKITSTLGGTNDYVYAFEYYSALGWTTPVETWDNSDNFTKSGFFFPRKDQTMTTTTINGVSGYWGRFKIVTKGTGTPAIDKIQRSTFSGMSHWSVHERYDIEYTGVDDTSTPVEGVEVLLTDVYGTDAFTGTSGVDGTITPADVLDREFFFDPEDASRNTDTMVAVKSYNPYVTKVRKYGYVPQEFSTTVTSIQKMNNMLTTNSFVTGVVTAVDDYTGITIDGAANTITIDEDHTIEEVYDYCQYWAALTASMPYDVPLSTSDGQNFTSTFDLIISSDLTGSGTISIGTGTLTLSGTSTLDITDSVGTYTNIKLTGLEAGSRVQLYDEDSTTELYNEVVTETTLTYPIIWTTDKPIRIRVMYVNGATAKKWFTTTATLTNTGINLAVNQEDDKVYIANLIDGSTVTECEIVGTTLVVNVDDPDNKTTAQRIYGFEVYWLSTEDGIRDQSLYINATDQTHYILEGGLKIKNLDMVNPLNITGANLEPLTGSATDILDTTGGMILINPETVVAFAYNVNGATEQEILDLQSQVRVVDRKVDDTQTRVITLTE